MPDSNELKPRLHDLGGGFMVRRLLPAAQRRSVGPFIFFDHFGPVTIPAGRAQDVLPHPHIGLSTVTYLFEGAMMHRDSLGTVQKIEPGALNWMTAGSGIVHSERTPPEMLQTPRRMHGLQLWAALPLASEEVAPSFTHTAAADLPKISMGGTAVRVLLGSAWGVASPVATLTPTVYLDIELAANTPLTIPPLAPELALYAVDQDFQIGDRIIAAQTLVTLEAGVAVTIRSENTARIVLIGGEPVGPRFMWWNFVSSSRERIQQAAEDWTAQRMGSIAGESEWIPLPEKGFRA